MAAEPTRQRSIRDQHRELTRSELVAAAAELFATKGYVNTTVNDIVAKAGAGRTTFYLYFPSKRAILQEALVPLRTRVAEIRDELFASPTIDITAIDRWIESYIGIYREFGGLRVAELEADLVEKDPRSNEEVVERVLHEWYAHGLVTEDPDSDDAAELRARTMFFTLGVQRFLEYWLVRGWPVDHDVAARTVRDAWLATGFRPR